MAQITKNQYEAQLQHIFRLLLDGQTDEQIAKDLNISVRSVQRYKRRLENRYGAFQAAKTDSTLFLECSLFKNRLLTMYRVLEQKALDPKTSGSETAKCCEVAANLAIDVLRLESEGIKAVKSGLVSIASATTHKNALTNLRKEDDDENDNESDESFKEYNPNRKF
ncbi:MAG TPA: helix-turn-helix domain-containing protein [Nitrososphaeraceae archaeon]|jgi:Homeodomain-like domain-containing protein|nr:helix-turn-helix domain-containing protein [Nitrososphaeraceae archaeon]